MKKKTYFVLTHIPLLGGAVKSLTKPMFCSQEKEEHIYDRVFDYAKKHPDIQITRQLMDDIFAGKKE